MCLNLERNIYTWKCKGDVLPYFQEIADFSCVVTKKREGNKVASPEGCFREGLPFTCSPIFFPSKAAPDKNVHIYDIQNIF